MFKKILIANRGEIACRIMTTARRLGIATAAVYSDADRGARHVALAGEAIAIGAAPASESYLDIERIVAAARGCGAEAVHPGYGFLSENAEFAAAVAAAGLAWIGPPASVIAKMGAKDEAKDLMERAGVAVVPGYHGAAQDAPTLAAAAAELGYPVMIKPVAGGGGKGMRRVGGAGDFEAALASARREARSAFGDDRVLVEKFIADPRHIEIQIFADDHGHCVHMFERDCSIQRRHQKIIEEAPAPGMAEGLRRAMTGAAITAARAAGYVGAGTVEFIVGGGAEPGSGGLAGAEFYFMEMNTRLQVEHGVSEMITGLDLVEWQFRVAAGEPLPLAQGDIRASGHAIEARIYAEDPAQGFLPVAGRLERLVWPRGGPGLRIDTGVVEGDDISIHYDPMIAKLMTSGADRAAAVAGLARALAAVEISGLKTNLDFLRRIAGHEAFAGGRIDTGFAQRHLDDLLAVPLDIADEILSLACVHILLGRAGGGNSDPASPWRRTDAWRLGGPGAEVFRFRDPSGSGSGSGAGAGEAAIPGQHVAGGIDLEFAGGRRQLRQFESQAGTVAALIDGVRHVCEIETGNGVLAITAGTDHYAIQFVDPRAIAAADEETGGAVTAPMPGKIIEVLVEPGATVSRGQTLLTLEAMKMEHAITAPVAGVIEAVCFALGDTVEEGAVLIDLAPGSARG